MVTGQINGGEYRRGNHKDNPEKLTTMVTGQINVRAGLSFFDCPFGLRYSPPFICSVAIVVSYSGLSFFTNKR
jgi:hypothetical protein